jgi:uncharacterized membrane protein YphA (DoxX/SURF4 family)
VSEPLLVRTRLVPSRLRRRLQQAAAAVSLLAAGLLAWAATIERDPTSPGFVLIMAAFVVTLIACALLLRGLRPRLVAAELAITANGTLSVVNWSADGLLEENEQPQELIPLALTPLSVVLGSTGQTQRRTLVVWNDSLPADGFRRLSAVARWRVERRDPQSEFA